MNKYFRARTYAAYAKRKLRGNAKRTYAQQGEDILIQSALKLHHLTKPTYLDIGVYDPIRDNNTYLMYKKGSRGVLVEPNPALIARIRRKRPRDIVIHAGVAPTDNPLATYYVMAQGGGALNTFKKEEADYMVASGSYGKNAIREAVSVPLISINAIMERYFPQGPDVLSLDAEGFDLELIRALDFTRFAPKIICVETLRYDAHGRLHKVEEIIEYVKSKGYGIFADTYTNTIFSRA